MNADPAMLGTGNGRVAEPESGRWLLLRDAVREIGSLEHLYRLARDGTLQSREDAHGRIEVWVTDGDRFDDAPTQSLDATSLAETVAPNELRSSEVEPQIGALITTVVQTHERHLELARENGALSERVLALERELQALHSSAASEERRRKWLDAVEGANTQFAQMPADARHNQPEGRRWPWLLLVASVGLFATVAAVWLLLWLLISSA